MGNRLRAATFRLFPQLLMTLLIQIHHSIGLTMSHVAIPSGLYTEQEVSSEVTPCGTAHCDFTFTRFLLSTGHCGGCKDSQDVASAVGELPSATFMRHQDEMPGNHSGLSLVVFGLTGTKANLASWVQMPCKIMCDSMPALS